MQNKINLITVDSLKIRIPLSKVIVIDDQLAQPFIKTIETTGEIIEKGNVTNKYFSIDNDIIKIGFQITREFYEQNLQADFLTIKITSKTLRANYLDGITIENIKQVYDYLMSLSAAEFSFNEFLKAEVTDVDFKKDVNLDIEFNELIDGIISRARFFKQLDRGYLRFNKKANRGIQFSKRETNQFKTNPFVKVYDKTLELETKSLNFTREYLQDADYYNLARQEITIKNKKHFKIYDIESTQLEDILLIPQTKLQNIMKKIMLKHTDPDPDLGGSENIPPATQILTFLIELLIEKYSYSVPKLIQIITKNFAHSDRTKYKKKITSIIDGNETIQAKIERSSKLNQLLQNLGID